MDMTHDLINDIDKKNILSQIGGSRTVNNNIDNYHQQTPNIISITKIILKM